MTYFKPETCQLLEKLGLVSDGTYWMEQPLYGTDEEDDYFAENGTDGDTHFITNTETNLPAYTPADIILSAENAKKLWGEENRWFAGCKYLLNKHLDGKDIEPLIAEAAKQRLEGK